MNKTTGQQSTPDVAEQAAQDALPVTSVLRTNTSQLLNPGAPGTQRRQPMRGFDGQYVDLVDYIVRVTHQIWEEGGMGRIYDTYRHNVIIHTTDGQTLHRDKVIADSIQTMSAFPDVRLFADDVIWCGNESDGFHSSHRALWVATNTGYSKYGPPTGRKVVRRGIAHCYVFENYISEEWIVRDELALVRQLGYDEFELARRMAESDVAAGAVVHPTASMQGSEVDRLQGQGFPRNTADILAEARQSSDYKPSAGGFQVEDFLRGAFHEIWNWRRFDKIRQYYSPNHVAFVPPNQRLYGWGDLRAFALNWVAAFPDLAMAVDHVCWLDERMTSGMPGIRAAVRWTMTGTHTGASRYGAPTGRRVRMLGISHFDLDPKLGKFVQEWTSYDEFALLKQLFRP